MKRFKKCTRSFLAFLLLVVLMAADVAPVWAVESNSAMPAEARAAVDDLLFERTFSIRSAKSGKYISGGNGAMANGSNYEEISVFRYGDIGADVLDDVPVALYLNTTGAYLSMSITERRGGYAFLDAALTRDGAEQFVLEKAADWSLSNLSYHIYHPQSGYYLDVDDSQRLYAYGTTAPGSTFVFTQIGYTNVGRLTTLPGYALLTDDQKQRVLDVYGGVGARSVFRYGGYDNEWTIENALRATATSIYENRNSTTAEAQATAMIDGMRINLYDGQTNWYGLPEVLYTAGTRTELSEGIPGTYDFWRGTMLEGMQYTFSVIDDYGTHTMTVYVENNSVAQTNANNLMEAIKQTPYPIRRNIRTIKVRHDEANSYNCGQYDLYMRLTWSPSANDIAQYITHEFGHSMDFSYNVSDSGLWQTAIDADVLRVSGYGSNNSYEDFADFGRMYFQQYGNYNGMYAIRQLYPNRYRVYTQALLSAQYEDIYDKYLYNPESVQGELYDGVLARFTFDDTDSGLKSGTAVAKATGTVVLDDNGVSGKALSLDGTGSNYLNVWKRDNTNLLKGYDEFTISYYSKPKKDSGSWPVFIAANAASQVYLNERYIGVLDTASEVNVERYNNYGSRPASLTAAGLSNADWRHVVLVVENNKTTLYINGAKVSELSSDMTVHDILGSHGVFQIGRGNWNSGEFYQGLIDEFTVYGRALTADEVQKETQRKQPLAHFTFDNGTSGMMSGNAIAVGNGNYEFSADSVEGGSLKLNGSGFVNIKKADGTPLMTGADEMTISYYSKSSNDTAPWAVYLSADANGQDYGKERYFGILDGASKVTVERYNNNGIRPNSIEEAHAKGSEWKHVVVVVENAMTTLYIDGEKVAYQNSQYALSDITGSNGIFQVGKGNWGNGEYYRGYIDEMAIWDRALSEHEIETYIEQDHSVQTGVVLADFDFDDEETGFVSDYGMATGTYGLRANGTGNALYLNGDGQYLSVTKRDGSSLLTGVREMTISMYAKPEYSSENWFFYTAPDDSQQVYPQEKYLGLLDKAGTISAERYNNTTARPETATVQFSSEDWYYITAVQTLTETIIYIDGEEVARQASDYSVDGILGADSVFYIGRGNWNGGEYYTGLIDNVKIQNYALTAEEVKAQAASEEKPAQVLADFDFDDEETGFVSDYGMATGTYGLRANGTGNALYLNGDGQYLSVTKRDGSSLLTGVREMTISMYAKPEYSSENWFFYTAPDDSQQVYPQEKYVALLDKAGIIYAERFNNTTGRPETAAVQFSSEDWYYITAVQTLTETIIYIDGEEVARQDSDYSVDGILGMNSIFYIGRGNWNNGEYYTGLIDNVKIQNYALTAEEVKAQAESIPKPFVQADKTVLQTALNHAVPETEKDVYTEDSWNAYAAALAAANRVNANADATQDEVDAAVKALTDAQAALKEKPAKLLVEDIFVDVDAEDWYRDSVQYVYDNGIMTGMNDTTFGWNESLTRAQFALTLYRMEGEPKVTSDKKFDDVSANTWYTDGVLWAYEAGIITGYANTNNFGPHDKIMREQMAVMMYRYAKSKNPDIKADADLGTFTDVEKVGSYAVEAMKWAVGNGIITGKNNGTELDPRGNTLRAEAAVVIHRFMEQ